MNGSVALLRAKVEVRATAPGLAYQLGGLVTSRNAKAQALAAEKWGSYSNVLASTFVIVALSLAGASDGGAALQIDPALHAPLDQSLIVCGTGAEAESARRLVQFINSTDGREIMTRYGFLLTNEQMSKRP